jgi:H+/Cl- antiporter ClcA
MATTTRSEKLKSIIKFTIILAVIYTIIVFVASFFILAWSWGEKTNFIQKGIVFLISKPLRPELSLWFIPLNGLFWSGIITGIKYYLTKK